MIKLENTEIKKLQEITKKLVEIKKENPQVTTLEAFQMASVQLKTESK